MFNTTKKGFSISKIKEGSNSIVQTLSDFISDGVALFKKDESSMTKEEKVEKQHVMTFLYGMVAGVIVYHFLIGVVLIAVVIGLYGYSVQKTKTLMNEESNEDPIETKITKK
ncbi:MAG: Unknown protein [uncultured Sulfurovum sp.]|uniref:Uncharacterized protein n=1 Tax=uncultured Sulfurovum sp. TaxID=269237 RepID=A0A6S6RYV3_9BACT|nr:MAG: Unknown protein [uncultured Sulfurovum sp.]